MSTDFETAKAIIFEFMQTLPNTADDDIKKQFKIYFTEIARFMYEQYFVINPDTKKTNYIIPMIDLNNEEVVNRVSTEFSIKFGFSYDAKESGIQIRKSEDANKGISSNIKESRFSFYHPTNPLIILDVMHSHIKKELGYAAVDAQKINMAIYYKNGSKYDMVAHVEDKEFLKNPNMPKGDMYCPYIPYVVGM